MQAVDQYFDRIIIGGGAAGFFAAVQCASMAPHLSIAILEKGNDVLSKVRISGGGRCNVTHACLDPDVLTTFYPRGNKELRGPFRTFNCEDTIAWFESKGVKLKTEPDGRMFPTTDDSSTIIKCLYEEARQKQVKILTATRVDSFSKKDSHFLLNTNKGQFSCEKLMVASGSSAAQWSTLSALGHKIVPSVPSLFTFNIQDARIDDLQGISLECVEISCPEINHKTLSAQNGPLLITHWGMSGPAVLRLSAWGARIFHEKEYRFDISINWLYPMHRSQILETILDYKHSNNSKQKILTHYPFRQIPIRLWKNLLTRALKHSAEKNWADLNKREMDIIVEVLCDSKVKVNGKSTFKEEFVTAGGVDLGEMNLKKFESKIVPGLYIAGEALNIDAVTGGFNFQAAWTGGYIAGISMAEDL